MVRLHRDQAVKLLILLSWVDIGRLTSWDDVEHTVTRNTPPALDGQDKVRSKWRNIIADYQRNVAEVPKEERRDITKLIKQLTEGISQSDAAAIDGELIDQVVNLLTRSYARNSLTGRTLQKLREVVLLPEEAAKLRTEVLPRELGCASCGRAFQTLEIATMSMEAEGPVFYCAQCETPRLDKCSGCGSTKGMNARLVSAIKKSGKCAECVAKEAKGEKVTKIQETPAEQAPVTDPARDLSRYVGRADERNRGLRPPTPAMPNLEEAARADSPIWRRFRDSFRQTDPAPTPQPLDPERRPTTANPQPVEGEGGAAGNTGGGGWTVTATPAQPGYQWILNNVINPDQAQTMEWTPPAQPTVDPALPEVYRPRLLTADEIEPGRERIRRRLAELAEAAGMARSVVVDTEGDTNEAR